MLLDEEVLSVSDKPEAAAVHLVFSRWMIFLVAIAIVSPWLVIASLLASRNVVFGSSKSSPTIDRSRPAEASTQASATPGAATSNSGTASADVQPQVWTPGKEGPWGRIDSMLFAIDVPDEYVFVPPANQPPVRWSFPGYTKEKVLATLRSVGITEDEAKTLETGAKWSSDDGVAAVEPGDTLILSLTPEVRSKLYAILVTFPQNAREIDPIWFRPDNIEWRYQDSGLAPESIALLKRLLYAQGDMLLFADFEPALRSLPDEAERRRFMKTVSRKRAALAHVRLDPNADVEKISQYWGIGGRRKDLFPLLSALHRGESGFKINVVFLLPDFARDHLYRHPFTAADDKSVKQDCFWSAFNFFNTTPDNRFNDMSYVDEVLHRDYYKIEEPSQLGDLVFVTVGGKSVIHVAAFVADDLVFTKNGEDFRQPWILMHMADMMDTYAVKYPNAGTLVPQYFRKKSL